MFETYSDKVRSLIDTMLGNGVTTTARIGKSVPKHHLPKHVVFIDNPFDKRQAHGTGARFGRTFVLSAAEENRQDVALQMDYNGHVTKPETGPAGP